MDADGESVGLGALFIDAGGQRWEVLARNVKLNRAGAAVEHSLAAGAAKVRDLSLTHERSYSWGNITVSLGYSDVHGAGSVAAEEGVRGFVTWRHGYR